MIEPKLSFERWNDLSVLARELSEDELADLLDEEQVTDEEYQQAEATHLEAIASGLAGGDSRLADARIARVRLGSTKAAATALDVDETLPIPKPVASQPALPFEGTTTAADAASMFSAAEGNDRAAVEHGETAQLPQMTLASLQTGTLRDKLGPVAVPELSLDEYAELQARLNVFGEKDATTLAKFGVAGSETIEALRSRFGARFQRDPAAARQFLERVQSLTVSLKQQRGGADQ